MKTLLSTMILAGLIVAPATAQTPGEMLFEQGCEAFELVSDLGSSLTKGRWRVRNLRDETELVIVFEGIDLVHSIN